MKQSEHSRTHWLQQPAVSHFDPVEIYYQQAFELWLISDSGEVVTEYDVFDMLWEAYGKAANVGNALEGFRATGLSQHIDSSSLNAILHHEKCWEGLKIPIKKTLQKMTLKNTLYS
jgi:hypothetical protein